MRCLAILRRSPGWGSSRRHRNVSKRPRKSSSRSLTLTRADMWRGQVSARFTPRLDVWIARLESGPLLAPKETGNWAGHHPTHAGTHCEERSLVSEANGDGANETEIQTVVEVGDDLTSQSRHSLVWRGSPPAGKLLIPLARRDVRVVEGARLEIDSARAC